MSEPEVPVVGSTDSLSLVDRIFTSFVDALALVGGYADTAERLRAAILDDQDFSEAALDRALFNVEQS